MTYKKSLILIVSIGILLLVLLSVFVRTKRDAPRVEINTDSIENNIDSINVILDSLNVKLERDEVKIHAMDDTTLLQYFYKLVEGD